MKHTERELKKAIKDLNQKRESTLESIGETISLAAKAGNIIASARSDGENISDLLKSVNLTDEQGKRLERVALHQHKLVNGDPGLVRQMLLWSEMLPDPIVSSTPTEQKPFLLPVIRVAQWLTSRGIKFIKQDSELRSQFMREAEPIVRAYEELK